MGLACKIGLTGGIGSGKSTVAAMLQDLGAMLIDADALSRQTTAAGGSAMAAIAQTFGPGLLDAMGALDRSRMRELVFSQPSAKLQLEAIIHPLVAAQTQQLLADSQAKCVVLDHPLLLESGHWRTQLDCIVVVDCLESTQISRTMARSGLSSASVQAIMATQASRAQRLACADAVLYNEGLSLSKLRAQVRALATRFGL